MNLTQTLLARHSFFPTKTLDNIDFWNLLSKPLYELLVREKAPVLRARCPTGSLENCSALTEDQVGKIKKVVGRELKNNPDKFSTIAGDKELNLPLMSVDEDEEDSCGARVKSDRIILIENLIGPGREGLALKVPDEVLILFQEATDAMINANNESDDFQPIKIESFTPKSLREIIKTSRQDPENKSDFNSLILLAYCLADEPSDLSGLPLLPLSNGEFSNFTNLKLNIDKHGWGHFLFGPRADFLERRAALLVKHSKTFKDNHSSSRICFFDFGLRHCLGES